MQEVMDFVVANYVWFVVGGIVIIMAIIGYFADKKGFGKPKQKTTVEEPKKEETVENKEEKTGLDVDNNVKEESVTPEAIVSVESQNDNNHEDVTDVLDYDKTNNDVENNNIETSNLDNVYDDTSVASEIVEPSVEPIESIEPVTDTEALPIEDLNTDVSSFGLEAIIPEVNSSVDSIAEEVDKDDFNVFPTMTQPAVEDASDLSKDDFSTLQTNEDQKDINHEDEENIWKF